MKITNELIQALKTWGENRIVIFDNGNYYEVKQVSRGLGYGVIFEKGDLIK